MKRFFLPGGRRVGLPLFEYLAQEGVDSPEGAGRHRFGRVAEVRDLSGLEQVLGCLLLAKAHEGAKDLLGAGMANDYILHKEWEAGRIRLLARRSFFGLPSSAVEPEVFCP